MYKKRKNKGLILHFGKQSWWGCWHGIVCINMKQGILMLMYWNIQKRTPAHHLCANTLYGMFLYSVLHCVTLKYTHSCVLPREAEEWVRAVPVSHVLHNWQKLHCVARLREENTTYLHHGRCSKHGHMKAYEPKWHTYLLCMMPQMIKAALVLLVLNLPHQVWHPEIC